MIEVDEGVVVFAKVEETILLEVPINFEKTDQFDFLESKGALLPFSILITIF